MKLHRLSYLSPLALCILMGCPAGENNDSPDKKDMTSTMSDMELQGDMAREDMLGKDMDEAEDMAEEDMRGEDMEIQEDMPQDMEDMNASLTTCIILAKPATIALKDVADVAITTELLCTSDAFGDDLSMTYLGQPTKLSGRAKAFEASCEATQDDAFLCKLNIPNLAMPSGDLAQAGVMPLTLSSNVLNELSIPLHFHEPYASLKSQQPEQAIVQLPENFARCGLDATVRLLGDEGSYEPVVFSLMMNDTNDKLTLSASSGMLAQPTSQSVDISGDDIMAYDFNVLETTTGFSAAAFAYNDKDGQFCGQTDHLRTNGAPDGDGDTFCSAAPASIKRIVDVQWGLRQEGDLERATARVMAITQDDEWVSFQIFGDSNALSLEGDKETTFMTRPASEVSSANTGFLQNARRAGDLNAPKIWQTRPMEGAEGVMFNVLSLLANGSEQIAELPLATTFPVQETFVGYSDTGKIFVLLLGEQSDQALFETELNGPELAAAVAKNIPKNVGLARRRKTAMDRRALEQRQKRKQAPPRQGLQPHTLDLISENGQTTALGRWPWDWRDRLKSKLTQGQYSDWNSPLDISISASPIMPVSVSWVDGEQDTTLVAPVVAAHSSPGYAFLLSRRAYTSMTPVNSGTAVALSQAALSPSYCDEPGQCIRKIGDFQGGQGIYAKPGIDGISMSTALYGEILISGEPIEFEDMVAPPKPVLNAPSALQDRTFFGDDMPDDSAIVAIATINHPTATHAVWAQNKSGELTGPGLVAFSTGRDDLVIDQRAKLNSAILGKTDDADTGTATVTVTAEFTVTYADASSQLRTGVGNAKMIATMPHDQLIASIGQDVVTTIDLSDTLPLLMVDTPSHELSQVTPGVFLPAPVYNYADTSPSTTPGLSATEEVLATFSGEDARKPLLVTSTGDGCGTFTVNSVSKGAQGEVELTTLTEHMTNTEDCSDQEVLLGVDDFLGDGSQSILSINYSNFTGRIKRVRIKKRRTGSGFKADIDDDTVFELVETTVSLAGLEPGDIKSGLSAQTSDFNGDAIADIAITSGTTAGKPQSTTVLFGNGLGGFIAETVEASSTPVLSGPTGPQTLPYSWSKANDNSGSDYRDELSDGVLTVHVCHL